VVFLVDLDRSLNQLPRQERGFLQNLKILYCAAHIRRLWIGRQQNAAGMILRRLSV